MRARGTVVGVAALLLTLVTGCGEEKGSGAASEAPARLRAAGAPSEGGRRFSCPVESAHGRVTMALVLPPGFRPGHREDYSSPGPGGFCVWEHEVTTHDESGPYRETVVVTLTGGNSSHELQEQYDDQKGDLVPDGEPEGDDSVLSLELHHDVPTYGGIAGERLDEWCYCDGQNTISRSVLADGVQLGYGSVHSLVRQADREFARILATAGRVR